MKKKRCSAIPKAKEFAVTPFAQLKGVQAAPAAPDKPATLPAARLRDDRDDMELFMLAMADVARLGGGKTPRPDKEKTPVRQIVRRIDESEQQLFLEALETLKLDKVFRDEVPEADAPVSASRRARQLRRGTIRVDYELDLHGLTRDEALEALASFIGGAYRRRQQAVLVITGRGNHSPDEPVLKKAVAGWLKNAGKEMVTETLPAPRQLGGEGAVVVFIRTGAAPGT